MPAASAMSRTVVATYPFLANSSPAITSSSAWRTEPSPSSVAVRRRPRLDARLVAIVLGPLTADGDDLASEVGSVVAGQEDDHVRDLPGLGRAAERLAPGQLGEQLLACDL